MEPHATRRDTEVREPVLLVADQQDQASEVLTRAFRDDPLHALLLPGAEQRPRLMRAMWAGLIKVTMIYGEVHTTPAVEGVACWLTPGNTEVTFWRMLRAGLALPRAVMRFPAQARTQFLDVMSNLDEAHKRLVSGSHWYLWALGVDPSSQGRGIGGRLLENAFARAGEDGVPCYLETQTRDNVTFYRKRGFEVVEETTPPSLGLPVWMMIRKP